MRVMLAILIASSGCTVVNNRHTSQLPPYVRELRIAREGGLEMIQCGFDFVLTDKTSWSWLRFGGDRDIETEIKNGKCWRTVVSTAVAAPQPLPAVTP